MRTPLDRFAIFVDAGYLYAEGGKLVCGTGDRLKLRLDFNQTVSGLVKLGRSHSAIHYLRTYWYDAATDASPNPSHLAVASIPGVKLRLGRLSLGKQKGVDSRIVRDLIVLAKDKAIAAAYVLSGDEDIREGVAEAQDCGVSVALIGIDPLPGQYNQARSLVQEADDMIMLSSDQVGNWIQLRHGDLGSDIQVPHTDMVQIGSRFGEDWAESNPNRIHQTLRGSPRIPDEVDRELLACGSAAVGGMLTNSQRHSLRDGFWAALDNRLC